MNFQLRYGRCGPPDAGRQASPAPRHSEDAVADADPLALDAPLLQQGLSLGRGEDLTGAVDPAAGDAEAEYLF